MIYIKPIIGITCAWSLETWGPPKDGKGYYYVGIPYIEAIVKTGGRPFMLPPIVLSDDTKNDVKQIASFVDAIVFTGGGDAKRFSSEDLPSLKEQQPTRYNFEAELIKCAWDMEIPVLGICRGHQMIAEVLGGEISNKIIEGHKQNVSGDKPWHEVTVNKQSKLFRMINDSIWNVNSFHRQVVEKEPKEFLINAVSNDDYIEGIESYTHPFFIGLQFHPEELYDSDEYAKKLFSNLIKAALDYKITKKNNKKAETLRNFK